MDSIIQFLLSVSPTLVSKHVFLFLFAGVSLEIVPHQGGTCLSSIHVSLKADRFVSSVAGSFRDIDHLNLSFVSIHTICEELGIFVLFLFISLF